MARVPVDLAANPRLQRALAGLVLWGLTAPVAFASNQAPVIPSCANASGTGIATGFNSLLGDMMYFSPVLAALGLGYGFTYHHFHHQQDAQQKGKTIMAGSLVGLIGVESVSGITGLLTHAFNGSC